MEDSHKLEEGLWTSLPKQWHINCYRLTLPLSRLDLDADPEGTRLVCRVIANGRVGLVGDRRRRSTILPIFFGGLWFHN